MTSIVGTTAAAELGTALQAWAAEHSAETLALLRALTELDAPSGNPELLAATAMLLRDRLAVAGAEVEIIDSSAGQHIRATFASAEGDPLAVLGHYDTVWPAGTAAERPLRVEAGVVRGPGVFDMRGGLVASIRAVEALRFLGQLRRPLTLLLTADEETGSRTSQHLIEALATEAAVVLVPEPPLPGGILKTQRKGLLTYQLAVDGIAAHAGLDPDRGASAVHALIGALDRVLLLEQRDAGTTVNVGTIEGGIAPNVIADRASATVDVRVARADEFERVAAGFQTLALADERTRLSVALLHSRPPMERTPAVAEAFTSAARLAAEAGIELREGAAGGASDSNLLVPLGAAVLDGLGPDGGGAHALDEHVALESLGERIVLVGLLLARLQVSAERGWSDPRAGATGGAVDD